MLRLVPANANLQQSICLADFVDFDEKFGFLVDQTTFQIRYFPLAERQSILTVGSHLKLQPNQSNPTNTQTSSTHIPSVANIKILRISCAPHQSLAIVRLNGTVELVQLSENSLLTVTSVFHSLRDSDLVDILGLHWLQSDAFLIISTAGLELQQISRGKSTRSLKTWEFPLRWYRYLHSHRLILCCTSSATAGTKIQVFQFNMTSSGHPDLDQWTQFDLNALLTSGINRNKPHFSAGSLSMISLYGNAFCAVVNQSDDDSVLTLFMLHSRSIIGTKFEIKIPLAGPDQLFLNTVDNLLVVNNLERKEDHRKSVVPVFTISALQIFVNSFADGNDKKEILDLYDDVGWKTEPTSDLLFHLDSHNIAQITLDAETLVQKYSGGSILELCALLIRRNYAGSTILKLLQRLIYDEHTAPAVIGKFFDQLNRREYDYYQAAKIHSRANSAQGLKSSPSEGFLNTLLSSLPTKFQLSELSAQTLTISEPGPKPQFPSQHEMYTYVFEKLSNESVETNYVTSIICEYLRSKSNYESPVDPLIPELLFHFLIRSSDYRSLHNLLQYRIFQDSKRLAEVMLSVSKEYKSFFQLAMDMLKRLKCHDVIIDHLLKQGNVMAAIGYVRDNNLLSKIIPRRFLVVALESREKLLFWNTLKFMEQRNMFLFGTSAFQPHENCADIAQHFDSGKIPENVGLDL